MKLLDMTYGTLEPPIEAFVRIEVAFAEERDTVALVATKVNPQRSVVESAPVDMVSRGVQNSIRDRDRDAAFDVICPHKCRTGIPHMVIEQPSILRVAHGPKRSGRGRPRTYCAASTGKRGGRPAENARK